MTTTNGPVTVSTVLGFLVRAGDGGATTTRIAQSFSYPASYHQRSNRVSQITKLLAARGLAERLGIEPSQMYHHSPVSRWRITGAGVTRHQEPARKGQRAARSEAAATAAGKQEAAITAAREEMALRIISGAGITRCYRAAKVRELRAVSCTLAGIGELFGLQRERVRQIEAGQEKPCACRECIAGIRLTVTEPQSRIEGEAR